MMAFDLPSFRFLQWSTSSFWTLTISWSLTWSTDCWLSICFLILRCLVGGGPPTGGLAGFGRGVGGAQTTPEVQHNWRDSTVFKIVRFTLISTKTHSFLLRSVFAVQYTQFLHPPPTQIGSCSYGNQSKVQRSSYLLRSQCSNNLLFNGLLDLLLIILVHLLLLLCSLKQKQRIWSKRCFKLWREKVSHSQLVEPEFQDSCRHTW